MKIGYCSWILFGKPLPEIFDFLHAEGCGCTSLLQGVMGVDRAEKTEAAAVIRQHGMTLCFHGNLQGHILPEAAGFDEVFLSRLYDEIDWWRGETGGLLHDCFSDSFSNPSLGGTPEARLGLSFELFRRHAARFGGTGIRYGIENTCGLPDPCSGECYNCAARFKEAHDLFGGGAGAGILLDIGHAHVASRSQGIDLGSYIDAIPFEIGEVHVTDNHGAADEHLRPGLGNLDFAALGAALARHGFDGPVNLEVCNDLPNGRFGFDLSAAADRDAVRTMIADLRRIVGGWETT